MAIEAPPAPGRAPGAARPRPKREREEEVLVWPDLVFVEFISAVLFTITFVILSVLINAPLLNRANTDVTPNPSKAPWYFLGLQELLAYFHPVVSGVLVPTFVLVPACRHRPTLQQELATQTSHPLTRASVLSAARSETLVGVVGCSCRHRSRTRARDSERATTSELVTVSTGPETAASSGFRE